MTKTPVILPAARSWREIPQQVTPRAMSREGRRRRWLQIGRAAGLVVALATSAWAVWQVSTILRSDPQTAAAAAAAAAEPIGDRITLVTDGVLDRAWLVRTLGLPRGATLLTLDLAQLRSRVLASGQVAAADIIRSFPATLSVHVSERTPVVRVMAAGLGGTARALLVARDGVVYDGVGYDQAMLRTLPWLDGVKLVRQGGGFARIDGMGAAADLLSRARLEAEHLYATWQVVSLARLQQDGDIAVRARDGLTVIFGTREDFFRQLARLDLLLDTAAKAPAGQVAVREINLSLGSQVPVAFTTPAQAPPAAEPPQRPIAPAFPDLHIQITP